MDRNNKNRRLANATVRRKLIEMKYYSQIYVDMQLEFLEQMYLINCRNILGSIKLFSHNK